jgi:L-threonylcarbamoyladenylate synthase
MDIKFKETIDSAVNKLKSGQIILCPTDTIYGLSCDAFNLIALNKVKSIKGRELDKGFIVLVESDRMLQQVVKDVPDLVWDIIDYANSPLTLVLEANSALPKELLKKDGTVAVRYMKDGISKEIIKRLNRPIISTSPNRSGEVAPLSFENISQEIINSCEFVIPREYAKNLSGKPSKIMKIMTNGEVEILRK